MWIHLTVKTRTINNYAFLQYLLVVLVVDVAIVVVVVSSPKTFPIPTALIVYDPVTFAMNVVTTKTYVTKGWRETVN